MKKETYVIRCYDSMQYDIVRKLAKYNLIKISSSGRTNEPVTHKTLGIWIRVRSNSIIRWVLEKSFNGFLITSIGRTHRKQILDSTREGA